MGIRAHKVFSLITVQFILTFALLAQDAPERGFSRMDLLDNTYVITGSDRLRYQVLEEQSPPVVLNPDAEGKVRFPPLLESIPIAGKTCSELATEVKSLLEVDFFYRATVVIEVTESSTRDFATIYGQVKTQGRIALPSGGFYTISQAISQAGGFSDGADLKNVTVLRKSLDNPEDEEKIMVNVDEIVNLGMIANDIRIIANDTIIVNKQEDIGGRYTVLGAVKQPGLYTIKEEDLTISNAILLAGGFTDVARDTRVKLTRRVEGSDESEVYYINVKQILKGEARSEDMVIKQDDIINVSEKIIVF
jgi:protein involved in polysaccharide export with SLBB domain